jgi:3-methyladenine DNA glycosylase AlkD
MKKQILNELHSYAQPEKVPDFLRYFKTGPGQYGEGDRFLGIKMPNIRKVVKKFHYQLPIEIIEELLYSSYHEERMLAVLFLVAQYKTKRYPLDKKQEIFDCYINNRNQINNWDLIDVTAPHIVGVHLLDKDKSLLYQLAKSDNLWDKRLSIISTFAFINNHEYQDTLDIADILLHDDHDLIHKAVGWAIRNVGIKDLNVELLFLKNRYKSMPRTMLRYAIEKFPEDLRQRYLKGLA